jgi:hypothetical protein
VPTYSPNKNDALYTAFEGVPFFDADYSAHSETNCSAKYFYKPIQDEVLNLIDKVNQIGVDITAKNISGGTISKGPVAVSGWDGTYFTIVAADSADGLKMCVGWLSTDVANGSTAVVHTQGTVTNTLLDTSASSVGAKVYLKSGGGATLTDPNGGSAYTQVIGYVAGVSALGAVRVRISPPAKMGGTMIPDGSLTGAKLATGAVGPAKITGDGTSTDMLMSSGSASNWVPISGDVTVNSSGVTTIGNAKVTGAKIASSTVAESNLASGAINLQGTKLSNVLQYANGGTGNNTFTANQLVMGSGLGSFLTSTIGSNNTVAVTTTGGAFQWMSGSINSVLCLNGSGNLAFQTGSTARSILGAAASGANSDISSILGVSSTGLTGTLRVAQQSAAGTPTDGDYWYDSTQKCGVQQRISNGASGNKVYEHGVLYVATAISAQTATGSDLSVTGSGIGSKSIVANTLVPGKSIRLTARGVYTLTTGSGTIPIKINSTVIGTVNVTATGTNLPWSVDMLVTCRTNGSSGTAFCQGHAMVNNTLTQMSNSATTTVNTTIALTIDTFFNWAGGSTGQSALGTNAMLEVLA